MYYLLVWPPVVARQQRDPVLLRLHRPSLFGAIMTSKQHFVTNFLMETIITSEQDLSGHEQPLPDDVVVAHFKLVGVGPNTLAKAGHLGSKICELATAQPGFFVIGSSIQAIREAMHCLVDDCCDAQEGINEPENQEDQGS